MTVPTVITVVLTGLLAAASTSPSSAQSEEPALAVSVEPLGVWCGSDLPVLITVRNSTPDTRWIGLHPRMEETVPLLSTFGYRINLDGNRAVMGITDGVWPGPPASGVALRPGDVLTFTDGFEILQWGSLGQASRPDGRPVDPITVDPPFTVRVDWELFGYESATGSPGTWERAEFEVGASFSVEPIEGSECLFARLQE